jgi:ankyrin repeat protein
LIELAKIGDVEAMRRVLWMNSESVTEVDDENGQTALIWASELGHKEAVEVLI